MSDILPMRDSNGLTFAVGDLLELHNTETKMVVVVERETPKSIMVTPQGENRLQPNC